MLRLAAGRLAAAAALSMAVSAASASPFDVATVTPAEWVRLPQYCPHTQAYAGRSASGSDAQKPWLAAMGETFWHMHHYCWGLLKALRAESGGYEANVRAALFRNAIDEMEYVRSRAPADFVLMPEILLRMGIFNAALQRPVEALGFFERSRAAKADYWPAYLEAARVNAGIGRREQAVGILKAGLEVMPQEPRLLEELTRLSERPTAARRQGRRN